MLGHTVEQPPVWVVGKRSMLNSYDTPHFRLCQILLQGHVATIPSGNQILGELDHRTLDERSKGARDI